MTERLTQHHHREWAFQGTSGKEIVAQSCPTLCDPMDCSRPGSSTHGIFQARILEWVAIPFSRDLPKPVTEPKSPTLKVKVK